MSEQPNLYKTLFVSETATAEQIRKAYFILAKKFHDDLNRSASPEERAFCENALKEINAAYEVLSKAERRSAYDRSRHQSQPEYRPAPPAPSAHERRRQPQPAATPTRLEFEVVSKVKCPFCGYENPAGSRTCRQCELPIAREGLICPYCGERLPSSACNCPGCGKFVALW